MKKAILKGVYIVVDPLMDENKIIQQLEKIKNENISAVQIWNNPKVENIESSLIDNIIRVFQNTPTPILINDQWELLKNHDLDGVHFEELPEDWERIREEISIPFIKGLTLQNDLTSVPLFNELNFDYLSFCSLFPSPTADQCEIVSQDTVEKCRKLTSKPIFLAGGINLENIQSIQHLPADGIAVVSSIMNAENPLEKLKEYNNILKV